MDWKTYRAIINSCLDNFYFDEEILETLSKSIKNNQKIFIAGNGGSSALASHYTCDLSKGAVNGWENNDFRYKVISLSDNISYITAISNDKSYKDIFKQQLINLSNPGDIVILISSSGNSPNILKAAEYAKNNGLITIGITGLKGGKLREICDYSAHVDTEMYETAEDVHSIFGHFIAIWLRESNEINNKYDLMQANQY
jgi:D-sedoheptulose 7-phosphate isomerase